ncbi:hypothetical protein FA95DRAFT_1497509, partial [Auriscalpium vulgare]
MRLARTLLTLVSCVVATARASSVRALRQHVAPRAQVDTCAYLDSQTLHNQFPNVFEIPLGLCLCSSGIEEAVSTNINLMLYSAVLGTAVVTPGLTNLVNDNGDVCTYPPGATPVCSQPDPCGFQCPAPYVQQGSQCACAAPYTSCNGVCDLFPNGCGSAVPQDPLKRNVLAGRSLGIRTHAEAQTTCRAGETVCGVPRGSLGFECLDISRTLDS